MNFKEDIFYKYIILVFNGVYLLRVMEIICSYGNSMGHLDCLKDGNDFSNQSMGFAFLCTIRSLY